MSKWIGYAVSVNCGEILGYYQGTILEADGKTITLTKAFRNGIPYSKSPVTLNAADIKELKIIEIKAEPSEQAQSTVPVTKNSKKAQRATVCENLQANPSSTGNQPSTSGTSNTNNNKATNSRSIGTGPSRSKPIDIQGNSRNTKNNNHNANASGSYGNSGSTPKAPGKCQRRRNDTWDMSDPAMNTDFDFEGNLALFDKRGLWERMRHQKPDVVRGAEPTRFRHDENVLGAPPPPPALAVPPELAGGLTYVTDDGVAVPSVSARARKQLWRNLEASGAGPTARVLLARAAADLALRLVGGARRLDAANAHQAPAVCCVLGRAGAAGVLAARLLRAHGVKASVLLPPAPCGVNSLVSRELATAQAAGVAIVRAPAGLPSPDLVLLALTDEEDCDIEDYAQSLEWVKRSRASSLAISPPAAGYGAYDVWPRAALVALLPPACAPEPARLYLANVAPPPSVFPPPCDVSYRSPFGANTVIPLYPSDN